jgi:hypothetical protein
MKPVHVLGRVHGFHYRVFRNMLRQWQLNDKTVHIGIAVQRFYCFQKLCLGNICFETQQGGSEADFFAAPDFGSYIGFAGTILAYENRG